MVIDLDVIIGRDRAALPLGILVALARKPFQRRPVETGEEIVAALPEFNSQRGVGRARPAGGLLVFRGLHHGFEAKYCYYDCSRAERVRRRQRESLTPRAPTLKEQSLLLKIGMSEQEVTKLLGLPPKAEVAAALMRLQCNYLGPGYCPSDVSHVPVMSEDNWLYEVSYRS
jgi:hypothetical protein